MFPCVLLLCAYFFVSATAYYHNSNQFEITDNITGFHVREVWGHSLAILDYEIKDFFDDWKKIANNRSHCRRICLVQANCKGVSWSSQGKNCRTGQNTTITNVSLAPKPGSFFFFQTTIDHAFYPGTDGIFYTVTANTGSYDAIKDQCGTATGTKRLAWPSTQENIKNIIGFAELKDQEFFWIALNGTALTSNSKVLHWEAGPFPSFKPSEAPFNVNWPSSLLGSVKFVINKNGVKAVYAILGVIYRGICMDNSVFSIEPW